MRDLRYPVLNFKRLFILFATVLSLVLGALLVVLARKGFAVAILVFFLLALGIFVTNPVGGSDLGDILIIVFFPLGKVGCILSLTGEGRRKAYPGTRG